jgi:Na+-transporting methylmalonyl-CoA/oxaloacetate decarboxylase gamma subunit
MQIVHGIFDFVWRFVLSSLSALGCAMYCAANTIHRFFSPARGEVDKKKEAPTEVGAS